MTGALIDETYCLTFVMPNCTLHLAPMSPSDRYARESAGEVVRYLPGETTAGQTRSDQIKSDQIKSD